MTAIYLSVQPGNSVYGNFFYNDTVISVSGVKREATWTGIEQL